MSRLNLTSWQRQRLRRQLAQTPDARVFRRTLAVLEFDFGRSAADIARMLGVARQTVYEWVDTYSQTLQATALEDEEGRGRHRLLDEDDEHLLEALLRDSPQDLGYPHTSWTVPLLQHALELGTGRQASDDTIRRFLRRLDYVWKRPRYILDPDPQLRGKKAADSPADPATAGTQRRAGPGRDRPLALPATARRLVQARRGRRGLVERPQRPPRGLRGHEPADGHPPVRTAQEGAER
jgi:transposase